MIVRFSRLTTASRKRQMKAGLFGFVRVWKIKVSFFFETTKDAIDFLGFYQKPGGGYLNFIKITFNFWFLKI